MARNPDSAAAINITTVAGKQVTQAQGGVTVGRQFASGGEAALTLFGLTRDLKNPTTFAYIGLGRIAYGARATITRPVALGSVRQRLSAGFDFQRQRDDRLNHGNSGGRPDTVRALDQLEHVTEVGPFLQSAVELTPHVTVTGGVRYDWVSFDVTDRLTPFTTQNPDDSGRRLMNAASGSGGIAAPPSGRVTVYANGGKAFEDPAAAELTQ